MFPKISKAAAQFCFVPPADLQLRNRSGLRWALKLFDLNTNKNAHIPGPEISRFWDCRGKRQKSAKIGKKEKTAKVPVEDHAFRAMLNITGVSEMPCLTKAATYPENSEKMPLFFVLLLMIHF